MLQQTQVERVRPYYEAWVARWPDAASLAATPVAEVIRAWGGLGYNRRAVHLHRAAVAVAAGHGGVFPGDVEGLRRLPGVGGYTARAVASFAFELPAAPVETNIGRVLARVVMGAPLPRGVPPAMLQRAADAALAGLGGEAIRHQNLALMDLGALLCLPRQPRCLACPLAPGCSWRRAGMPSPGERPPPAVPFERTARFARGRVVAALREHGALAEETLVEMLPAPHRAALPGYLAALAKDGLIERCSAGWRLAHG